jgi:5-methylcytosine-specific restriction endonuclease McrA
MNEESAKREREKARAIRKSSWWTNQLSKPVCYYCEIEISRKDVTMDHIVPISRGGKSTRSNIVLACKSCNTQKKDMTAFELISIKES